MRGRGSADSWNAGDTVNHLNALDRIAEGVRVSAGAEMNVIGMLSASSHLRAIAELMALRLELDLLLADVSRDDRARFRQELQKIRDDL
jgi:hypothetical protein